jgi:hypothetical protein
LTSYYDQLDLLRDHLTQRGYEGAARELLTAERAAGTFGELISNVGVVLRKLIDARLDDDLQEELATALAEGQRLWDRSNQ